MASRAGRRRARESYRAQRATTPVGGHQSTERRDGREWVVRRVAGSSAAKDYRCPGCARTVPAGTAHVVAWPLEPTLLGGAGPGERRHWHTACWGRGLTAR